MKFKSNIEIQAGLEDASGSPGTVNQLLSSTATGTAWIDPSTIVAEAATLVVIACKNTSGAAIAQGTPVYQTGTVGATATIEIAPADALISANKLPAIGLLQTALNNNGFGFVVITGELTNFTTSPIDGVVPTTGDKVFVKSGGGLTLTKPTGEGNGIQNMGLVGKVSSGNSGSITVSSIMRTNDVPNLPEGRIWVGDGNTIVSDTVYVDEPNNRVGIGTISPGDALVVKGGSPGNIDLVSFQNNAGNETHRFYTDSANDGVIETVTNAGVTANLIQSSGDSYFNGGNVGIGTTSPGFKLTTNGVVAIEGSRGTYIDATEDSSATGHIFVSDDSVGDFSQLAGNLVLQARVHPTVYRDIIFAGGLNTANPLMTITGEGKVGIGTTSPGYKLHVNGGDAQIANGSTAALYMNNSANYLYGDVNGVGIVAAGNNLRVKTNNSERLRIIQNGNVGIGTTSPVYKLDVRSSGNLFYGQTDLNNNTSVFRLKGNGGASSLFEVKADGNVGIGTTSPSAKLTVKGAATAGLNQTINIETGGVAAEDGGSMSFSLGSFLGSYPNWRIGQIGAVYESTNSFDGALVFKTSTAADSGTEKMRIASDGAIKFNTYGAGTLVTDSSGNITVSSGGGAGGPYLPLAGGTMTGTNGVIFPDDFKLNLGTGSDLEIYHDGSGSYIQNNTGNFTIRNYADDTSIIFQNDNGGGGIETYFQLEGASGGVNPFTVFPDNSNLAFGSGHDLRLYHDGSNSYIDEIGTGSLIIKSSTIIEMKGANNEYLARFIENGSVDLYYNNSLKFETTGSGVLVLGDIQIDSALLSNQENTDVDTGTETVANVAIATYTAAFFDFVIKKTTNVRSGTVYACHDGTSVEFTETSTNDLGDTSDVTLSVDISGVNMRLLATVASNDWSVKSLIRAI